MVVINGLFVIALIGMLYGKNINMQQAIFAVLVLVLLEISKLFDDSLEKK